MSHSDNHNSAFFGALTDLNVWDRSLSKKEVKDFASCQGQAGNYMPWSDRTVQYENMMEEDVDLEEICAPPTESIIIGSSKKSLDLQETQQFCGDVLGGSIAVAENRELFEAGSHSTAQRSQR